MADNLTEKKSMEGPDVVRAVIEFFKAHPTEVVDRNGEAVGGLWQSREIGIVLPDGKRVRVRAFMFLNKDDISVTVADYDLPLGEPLYNGRPSYRVDIKGGEAARSYAGSIGFATGNAAVDLHGNIISDNWTETENDPEEIISILKNGKPLRP